MNKVINFENLELGAKIRVVENGGGSGRSRSLSDPKKWLF